MSNKKTNCVKTQDTKKTKRQRNSRVAKTAVLGTVLGLCASAIVGLSVALYFADKTVETHESYQRQMDAVYFRAYYDLIEGANDMGVMLKKLGVSNSPTMQQSMLYEVWSAANLAENSLGMFESQDDGILRAQKFVNQLGDYSHALALRVAAGKPLTEEERERLSKLAEVASVYQRALTEFGKQLEDGNTFMGEDGALNNFTAAFSEFSQPDFAYPEMIYDGPFSDALENKQLVGMGGKDITAERGEELLNDYLSAYEVSDVAYIGEGEGDIPTYNFMLTADGAPAFAQICKRGGMLISYNVNIDDVASSKAVRQDAGPTCQQNALAFASKLGFDNMQVVWSSSAHGECVVNLAPVQEGVILYSDLVKVKLREEGSRVIGLDATHYAFNHRERKLDVPTITAEQAKQNLSIPAISEGRLALIPLRGTKETLTYEFECEQDGTYFVYIDALSGDEANILYVIDDEASGMRTI